MFNKQKKKKSLNLTIDFIDLVVCGLVHFLTAYQPLMGHLFNTVICKSLIVIIIMFWKFNFFYLFINICSHTVIWYQVFLSNTNNSLPIV